MSGQTIANIGYVAPMVPYPTSAATDPEKRANMVWDWRAVPMNNGRDIPGGARLDTNGFVVVAHESGVPEFEPAGNWRLQYATEIEDLVRELTGAQDVFVPRLDVPAGPIRQMEPAVRYGSSRLSGPTGTVDFCHNDYTAASVGRHIAELDPERAEERLRRRFAIYNTWRLVSPPPQSKPLAICDPTSITIADLVPGETYYYDEIYHQNALFRYNPDHRWYWYPDLQRDELLIWAGFDSDPGQPSIVPHCAFDNPDCDDPDACRISIDCRAFVFFDE